MKRPNLSLVSLTVALFIMLSALKSNAQTNHVFHVNTMYMAPNIDSAERADCLAALKEYMAKVTMKNTYVIHQTQMVHFFSEDSREFVTVTEYGSWGDIEKAFAQDEELEKQAWPDAQKREAFLKKISRCFTHHKDAIYNGLPGLTK